jgi:membrane fusion protein (multidrug efflux system)
VVVFTVNPAALPMSAELPGRTNAYQVADVRPQVGGLIQKRCSSKVAMSSGHGPVSDRPGHLPGCVQLGQGGAVKAKANLLTAGPKAARYKELVAIEGVSRQEYDDAVAAFEQAKADVESATAALETANINLKYSTVTAPISGRTSRSTVTAGALVTAGQADALTTVQLDPIYVDVTQSSTDLLRLKRQMADGSLKKW